MSRQKYVCRDVLEIGTPKSDILVTVTELIIIAAQTIV